MPVTKALPSGFVPPCIPTRAAKPPIGADWVHEIKHDGYRLIVRREGKAVRLFTRRGFDWIDRYPGIASAAAKLKAKSFTIDGEAARCGANGLAVFEALHRRRQVDGAILFGFDLLELNGLDLRSHALGECKADLARPLAARRASNSMSIPRSRVHWYSSKPARWALKASCRSGSQRRTGQAHREIGSRSRTRTAQQWCDIARRAGDAATSRLWLESDRERSA
jgi:ATP-dependent DNA ligase